MCVSCAGASRSFDCFTAHLGGIGGVLLTSLPGVGSLKTFSAGGILTTISRGGIFTSFSGCGLSSRFLEVVVFQRLFLEVVFSRCFLHMIKRCFNKGGFLNVTDNYLNLMFIFFADEYML
jgi:hypothetical protein